MATPGYNTGGQNISGQFGMPLYGIMGILPPFSGNSFWVDTVNGSDGNTGGPQDALATIGAAYAKCVSGNNDVVYFTGIALLAATLTWAKNKTHLIGLSSGPFNSSNALIQPTSFAATAGAFSPMVNVTGTGCRFENISAAAGIAQAAAQVTWAEAGGHNAYLNCQFAQTGNATAAAQAGSRALTIASLRNFWSNCIIGGDGLVRATGTNSSLEFLAGAGSNIFRGCTFPMWSSVAANTFLLAATATCTGFMLFDDCQFVNAINNAGGTALTQAFSISATAGASFILTPLSIVAGATILNTAGTGTIYVSSAVAAAGGNKVATAT